MRCAISPGRDRELVRTFTVDAIIIMYNLFMAKTEEEKTSFNPNVYCMYCNNERPIAYASYAST